MASDAHDMYIPLSVQLRYTRQKEKQIMATRAELNEQAEALGLNPDDYANIDEITAAIADAEDEGAVELDLEPGLRVTVSGGVYEGRTGEIVARYSDTQFRVRLDDASKMALVDESDLTTVNN